MIRILSVAIACLSLASCASMKKKEESTSCCAKPAAKPAACAECEKDKGHKH